MIIEKSVLPTRPIYRQTAVFQTLGADRDFEEIGCRFFADRNFGKSSRIWENLAIIWPIFSHFWLEKLKMGIFFENLSHCRFCR